MQNLSSSRHDVQIKNCPSTYYLATVVLCDGPPTFAMRHNSMGMYYKILQNEAMWCSLSKLSKTLVCKTSNTGTSTGRPI